MKTSKEIADDVQQTFDNVSNSYRNTLENRIEQYASQESEREAKEFEKWRVDNNWHTDRLGINWIRYNKNAGQDFASFDELYQQFKNKNNG